MQWTDREAKRGWWVWRPKLRGRGWAVHRKYIHRHNAVRMAGLRMARQGTQTVTPYVVTDGRYPNVEE